MLLLLLSLTAAPKSDCVTTGKEPVVVVNGDKKYYVQLLEGEEAFCEQLTSDFNSGKARRVCGCQHSRSQYDQDVLRLRCVQVVGGKIYSGIIATYYYYPDSTSACIAFRDHLSYKAK